MAHFHTFQVIVDSSIPGLPGLMVTKRRSFNVFIGLVWGDPAVSSHPCLLIGR